MKSKLRDHKTPVNNYCRKLLSGQYLQSSSFLLWSMHTPVEFSLPLTPSLPNRKAPGVFALTPVVYIHFDW